MSLPERSKNSIARTAITDESGVSAMFTHAAVTTVDINSEKVFKGLAFGTSKRISFPATPGLVSITFDSQAVTKDKVVLLPMSFKAFGAGPVNIDIYFGGTYGDDGTLIDVFNRDNESANTPKSILRLNPTITTKGLKLPPEFVIFSNGTPAVTSIGGEVIGDFISLLRKDGKYLIELSNQDNTIANGWFGLDFFEVNKGE